MQQARNSEVDTGRVVCAARRGKNATRDIAATRSALCGERVTTAAEPSQSAQKTRGSQMAAACQSLAFERKWFAVLIHTMRMMKFKTTHLSCFAALLLGATQQLRAFTYTDTDLILVFRKDTFNDIEFNLGTVSNFLGKADGTTFQVTNFSLPAVTANFGSANLSGVSVSLLASTPADVSIVRRAWLTCGDAAATPLDVTGTKFSQIWSKVNAIGDRARISSGGTSTNLYTVNTSDQSAYTYIASNAGQSPDQIGTFSGVVPFTVDNTAAGSLRFFEVKVSALNPKPNSTQIGVFSITSGGVLTFTAGSGVTAPLISSHPTNGTVFSGGTANFAVTATGTAPLSYQWYSNNVAISGALSSSYNFIARTNANGAGFKVVVSNSGGSVTSSVATLTVNLPVAAQLANFVKPNANAPFALNFSGTANAYYEVQSSTNLSSSANWITIAFLTNGAGGTTSFADPSGTNTPQKFYRVIAR